MFESSLITKLSGDTDLLLYLSTFNVSGGTMPSIFSEFAPETAQMPYLVFRITQSSSESLALKEFNVYVDYYDYNKSSSNSRKAAERIEFILDRTVLNDSERFGYIRMYFYAGSPVQEEDLRLIHYNLQFTARAGRKKWMKQITSTTIGS